MFYNAPISVPERARDSPQDAKGYASEIERDNPEAAGLQYVIGGPQRSIDIAITPDPYQL